jgi:hypothetical protein
VIEPTLKSHMRKNRVRLASLLAAVSAAAVLGCSGKPGSVTTPDVDPEEAAELAVEQYDKNADSLLSGDELAACPALKEALPGYDGDGNGLLSPEEISTGIARWEQRGMGAIVLPFTVTLDGRPLGDAQVKLTPVPFIGDAVKPAAGIADSRGAGALNMAPEDRPSNLPKNVPAIQPGLYNVEITHPSTKVPAKYNTATTLGLEAAIAGQNPSGVSWSLTSK